MEKNQLYAGAARCDITPNESLMPMTFLGPVLMKFVADRIHGRVLYIENQETKVLIVALDMGEVPYPEELIPFLEEVSGVEKKNILITATHTHEVPFIGWPFMPFEESVEKEQNRVWFEQIKNALKKAVKEAISKKCKATMGYEEGKSYINVNRDELIDGKAVVGNNYERPSDKTLSLIRFEDEDKNVIALLINYAVHNVLLNGCMVDGGIGISGDIAGRTSTILEDKLGGVALWTSGAAGDQNPRICTNYGYVEGSNGFETKSVGEAGYMILDGIVAEHVRNIEEVNGRLSCEISNGELKSVEKTVFIKAKGAQDEQSVVPFTIKLMHIANLAIQGISAEVVTTIGESVRKESNMEHTIMITHAQGCMSYTPDDWEYNNEAFVVGSSLVEKGYAEPVFIKGFQECEMEILGKNNV